MCGYGSVGHTVVGALRGRFEVVIVDEDARTLRGIEGDDVRVINGDASMISIAATRPIWFSRGMRRCEIIAVMFSDRSINS